MADDILDLAERLWTGEADTYQHHPVTHHRGIAPLDGRTAFVASLANVTAMVTDGGLFLVDTGGEFVARKVHEWIRTWNGARLDTAVYSHGHIDHVFGVPVFEEEASANRWAPPKVIAHEHLPRRFDRYVLTAGYNGIINTRQFGTRTPLVWPTEYRYPDETYHDHHTVEVGGERFELHHCRGETDDHTWTWAPERKVLCPGDLFIWATPNAGNPQKVQRYAAEWAVGLRQMAGLGAEVLLPGHGLPIVGADRIRTALTDTAELLESLQEQTLALLNEGARLDDILHSVRPPRHLMDKPYLQPVYDEPEFIVRNVVRCLGGWWSGVPSELKPAPRAQQARELVALAGGVKPLLARAAELLAAGDLRMASHWVDWAAEAEPDSREVHGLRSAVYARRVELETSTMSKGIFRSAANDSNERAKKDA